MSGWRKLRVEPLSHKFNVDRMKESECGNNKYTTCYYEKHKETIF